MSMVETDDELWEVNDLFYKKGWTDGLPIIPPTRERVERMVVCNAPHPWARVSPRLALEAWRSWYTWVLALWSRWTAATVAWMEGTAAPGCLARSRSTGRPGGPASLTLLNWLRSFWQAFSPRLVRESVRE